MTQEELIRDWQIRAKRKANAHAQSAARATKFRYLIGVPSVILSAITAAAVFAEIESDPSSEFKLCVVAIIIIAAVLTSLQTFFNFGESAELHKAASATFSKIRRKTDKALVEVTNQPINKEKVETLIDDIEERFNETIEIEPLIPKKIWVNVEKKYSCL